MTLQEQRDIIQAAIDGKIIECRSSSQREWMRAHLVLTTFNFAHLEYRVKRKDAFQEWWREQNYTALEDLCEHQAKIIWDAALASVKEGEGK